MKVKELIEELCKYDKNSEVVINQIYDIININDNSIDSVVNLVVQIEENKEQDLIQQKIKDNINNNFPYKIGTKLLVLNGGKGAYCCNNKEAIVIPYTEFHTGLTKNHEGFFIKLINEDNIYKVHYPNNEGANYKVI
jgi:hypothetical protein